MDNRNNLVPDMPLSHLTQQLSTRNVVMQANSTFPISVGEAAKNDESMKTILEKIASGEIRAAAPCDAVFNVWSDDEKKKLIQAMEKIFPSK